MPTPPKETIGGTKGHQILAFDFAQRQFEYIEKLENFKTTEDFSELPELERNQIDVEIEQQNFAYETLRLRVNDY